MRGAAGRTEEAEESTQGCPGFAGFGKGGPTGGEKASTVRVHCRLLWEPMPGMCVLLGRHAVFTLAGSLVKPC